MTATRLNVAPSEFDAVRGLHYANAWSGNGYTMTLTVHGFATNRGGALVFCICNGVAGLAVVSHVTPVCYGCITGVTSQGDGVFTLTSSGKYGNWVALSPYAVSFS